MSENLGLLVSLFVGVFLGGVFFGGLWWTVKVALSSGFSAVLFLGSLLLRSTVTMAGFYLVSGGQWQKLGLCLLGFILARQVVKQLTKRKEITDAIKS